MMQSYKVKVTYKYSEIVEVEAESETEAIKKAIASEDTDEQYECLYDAEVVG